MTDETKELNGQPAPVDEKKKRLKILLPRRKIIKKLIIRQNLKEPNKKQRKETNA